MSLAAPTRVVLYGADSCHACQSVVRKLSAAGWEFEAIKIDIDNPAAAANDVLRAALPSWSGYVPVLEIDGLFVELGQGQLWEAFAPWPLALEATCV